MLNKREAQLFLPEVTFLGQSVGCNGKRPLLDWVIAIANLNRPTTITGLRSVMGLFNFSRIYIPDFSDLARPLTEALKGGTESSRYAEKFPSMDTRRTSRVQLCSGTNET